MLLATSSELTHLLGLVDCRFESHIDEEVVLPTIRRDGTVTIKTQGEDTNL